MNNPKLRFKEFASDWKIDNLSDLSSIIDGDRGKNYPKEKDFFDDEFCLFLNAGNVTKLGFDLKNKLFITKEKDQSLRNGKLERNDIVLTTRGTVGNVVLYNNDIPFDNVRINSGMVIVRNKNKIIPEYLYSYMKSPMFESQVNKTNFGSAQPQLTIKGLAKFKVSYPEEKEQIKVSNFLSLLDKKIELQSKKIEDLKLFKLSQSNLIKIDDSYKKISLKDILKEYNEKSTINNQYEILSSTAKGIFLQSEYFNKQAASENNIGYKILRKNQLVLSPQNLWMGNININNKYEIGIVSPSYKIFDINTNVINIEYFKNWIKSPRALYEYMISSEQGASIVRRNLNMDLFNEITLSVPNMNEQNKIGKMLSLIDNKILLEEDKYKKLLELKKGLMQNMFV